jgi:hypothetical protein
MSPGAVLGAGLPGKSNLIKTKTETVVTATVQSVNFSQQHVLSAARILKSPSDPAAASRYIAVIVTIK